MHIFGWLNRSLGRSVSVSLLVAFYLIGPVGICKPKAPLSSEQSWEVTPDLVIGTKIAVMRHGVSLLNANHIYTLAELIDIAERQNPETKAAWELARQRAASLGIAESDLYPTLAVAASLSYGRNGLFFDGTYFLQTALYFRPVVAVSYTLFDFGRRRAQIDLAKANLLAANLRFNDIHRRVIYRVTAAYYQLMLVLEQQQAAQATYLNARTVQQSVEERLVQGLATLPDVLEAQAATASAEYDLVALKGEEANARGELASVLGESPVLQIQVLPLASLGRLNNMQASVEKLIEDALTQRPDLLARAMEVTSAKAQIKQARAAYFPKVTFNGNYGYTLATATQTPGTHPGVYTGGQFYVYQAQVNLDWTLFDGGRRKGELALAKSIYRQAEAEEKVLKDEIEYQVWRTYNDMQTAIQQLKAANLVFTASSKSYEAAMEAYRYGVRNFIDVTTAQRTLAQAQSKQAVARIQVLISMANLAFQTGDLLKLGRPPAP